MAKRIVIMPAYNEGRTILGVLERCLPHADAILVVDDGSKDNTYALVQMFAEAHPQVTLLALAVNQGMSGALLAGFCYAYEMGLAPDDWIITMDADGQHLPEELPGLVAHAEAGRTDVLLGRRYLRGYPWFKWVGNWGLSVWAKLLTRTRYYDVECGFRLFRAVILRDLIRFFTGRRYGCAQEIAVITACCGWKVDNTPRISIAYYRPGTRVRDGLTNMWMGLVAWWKVTRGQSYDPANRVRQVLAGLRPATVVVPEGVPR